jgi:hypothetical protein
MSLLVSPPDGLSLLGWRRVALTALVFSLAPALVGGAALLVALLVETLGLANFALQTEGMATFALVTPLFTAPIWSIIALATWSLLRQGWFGWLPAALMGALAFAVLMRTEIGSISLPFGAASALLYRMALALQRPEAI